MGFRRRQACEASMSSILGSMATETLYGYIQTSPSWEDSKIYRVIILKKHPKMTPDSRKWDIDGASYYFHPVPVCIRHHDSIEEARECLAELMEHPAWTLLKYSI
jgi:hypothetical protein